LLPTPPILEILIFLAINVFFKFLWKALFTPILEVAPLRFEAIGARCEGY